MKTIVVSGAHSNVGKTNLALKIRKLISGSVYIKIGHGTNKKGKDGIFYHTGTSFEHISGRHSNASCLIIESNQVLKELSPDCAIFLTGNMVKPSAVEARKKADITRGTTVSPQKIKQLMEKLGLPQKTVHKIIWLAGARPIHTTGIILAGGQSTRMGYDKALLDINGENTISRLYNLLTPYFDEIILSTTTARDVPFAGIRIVPDSKEGIGPLMGIYSSLAASQSSVNFIIACDIPKVNMTLLFELLATSEEYDMVVPSFTEGQYEPLFAVYKTSVAQAAKRILDQKKRRIIELFSECKTQVLAIPDNSWYINLNTPEDYHSYLENTQNRAG